VFDNLRQDAARLAEVKGKPLARCVVEGLLFENGFQAVVLHRVAHWFRSRNIRVLGPFFARWNLFLTGVDIAPSAVIGPGLYISHGTGLVIGGGARLGARAFLLQGVTIGAPTPARVAQMPTLGDDVFVGAGACIIGDIRVGSRVFIGVNAVVARDVPDDCKVLAAGGVEVTPRGARGEEPGLAIPDAGEQDPPHELAGVGAAGNAPGPEDTWNLAPRERSRAAAKPAARRAGKRGSMPPRPGGPSA
jgi:serine O-acetyltransferase